MIFRTLILFLFLLTFNINLNAKSTSPKAIKGVMDLRDIPDPDLFSIKLNGEWEFYWKRMLRPHDFRKQNINPDYYGKVPSYWTDYPQDSVKTEKFGYATYRLTILLPDDLNNSLAIDLPVFDSSYDIYIGGRYMVGNGTTGTSAEETEPEYIRNFYRLDPVSDSLTIIINVSNYDHRRGGFWLPVKFGTFSEVKKRMTNNLSGEWSVISLLLGFSLFFLFFFMISPREKIMGFFSLITAGLAIRPLFTSNFLIHNLMTISWDWIVKLEYLALYMVIIGGGWFINNLYPSRFFKKIAWAFTIIFSMAFIITIVQPVKVFSYIILIYHPSIIVLLAYALFKSFSGALKKNIIDIIYFLAFCLLLSGGLHDIRVSLGKAEGSMGYLLTYIIVVFVFIQASLLLYKWVTAFHDKEKLQNELEFMNKNLEVLIKERTQELQTRNEEIEKQNSKIALQNKQLSETIQLKNRIFSVIAHDLRSPVVNILYMLNLLKEKEYKEKYAYVPRHDQLQELFGSLMSVFLVNEYSIHIR